MCSVSNVGDIYARRWANPPSWPPIQPGGGASSAPVFVQSWPTQAEFDALKAEVLEMKELLKAAKAQDIADGIPDCEMEDKVAILKKVAEMVGVDLAEVFGK